jgi:MOSC domain-containing protein YiiM
LSVHGRVLALFAGGAGFVKNARATATVDAGGVRDDRHHGRDPARALLLVPAASYRALADQDIDLPYGSMGENVVVDGLPETGLAPGTLIALGPVMGRVEAACTVCSSLAEVHPRLPKAAYGRRGVYLRVVRGGPLRPGDAVRIVVRADRLGPRDAEAFHASVRESPRGPVG